MERRDPDTVAQEYEDILYEITGYAATAMTQKREIVWLRFMIAYQMRADGYSTTVIGNALGLCHSSVIHATKNMRQMLAHPAMYRAEMKIWHKFQEILYSQKA